MEALGETPKFEPQQHFQIRNMMCSCILGLHKLYKFYIMDLNKADFCNYRIGFWMGGYFSR